jgi:uncharacterized protein YkwD
MNVQNRFAIVGIGCLLALAAARAAPAASIAPFDGLEQKVLELVNARRGAASLEPYEASDELAQAAREHSQDMSIGKVEFGHAGFGDRQAKAFSAHGANHTAENVGWNTQEGDAAAVEAVDKWMKSKAHKAHILGKFEWAGVGVARGASGTYYFTLLMAGTLVSQ